MSGEHGEPQRRAQDALATYFVGESTMSEALTKLCAAALDAVAPAELAGISMTVDARIGTYVFTHPEVIEIDQSQYDTGDGPCVDAFSTGETVIIESTREPGPYPQFRAAAAQHGYLSTLSQPLVARGHVVGALNLYARSEHAFHAGEVEAGEAFATQAAYLLLNHQAYWDAKSLSEHLEVALKSRAEIDQATGIIMAATGCSADDAFQRLRQQSQHENIKLRDIAHEIVTRAQRNRPRDH